MINTQARVNSSNTAPLPFSLALTALEYNIYSEELIDFDEEFDELEDDCDIDSIFE